MRKNPNQIEISSNILESVTAGSNIYTVEKRKDNFFLIKKNTRLINYFTHEQAAREEFEKYRKLAVRGGDSMNNEGAEKLRQTAEKLRQENSLELEKTEEQRKIAISQIQAIKENEELAKMYSDSARVGADNLGASTPLLKVHAAGKSTTNILSDGSTPNDGWFFYKPTGEQFEFIDCHILTISRGFRAEGMEKGKDPVFNQLLGGVFGNYEKPFILFLNGVKLSPMWDFGKEASVYTKSKPIGIPMFALTVRLTTEKIKTNFGFSWRINFMILKNQDGSPELVLDPGAFQFLRDSVDTVEEMINSIIATKSNEHTVIAPSLAAQEDAATDSENIPF